MIRVEDAPATRSEADYNSSVMKFLSVSPGLIGGARPAVRHHSWLPNGHEASDDCVGARSGASLGILGSARGLLRRHNASVLKGGAHRAAVQTKGYKLVEMVRIYEVAGGDLDARRSGEQNYL